MKHLAYTLLLTTMSLLGICPQSATLNLHTQNLCGKRVLIKLDTPGYGLGDQLMFIRYARLLKQAGAHIIVKTIERLHPLLRKTEYIDELTIGLPATYDYCLDMNIRSLMQLIAHEALHQNPYLYADTQLIHHWQKKISSHTYKVGIFWQHITHVPMYKQKYIPGPRAIPLDELATLTTTAKIDFYSLQIIYWPHSIADVQDIGITILHDELDITHGAFMDSAAIMCNMDLIITVDSAIAHLAGALGIPVWLLLSIESDDRWQNEYKTKWYPTMRIYRSRDLHSWIPLLVSVQSDLIKLTNG